MNERLLDFESNIWMPDVTDSRSGPALSAAVAIVLPVEPNAELKRATLGLATQVAFETLNLYCPPRGFLEESFNGGGLSGLG